MEPVGMTSTWQVGGFTQPHDGAFAEPLGQTGEGRFERLVFSGILPAGLDLLSAVEASLRLVIGRVPFSE